MRIALLCLLLACPAFAEEAPTSDYKQPRPVFSELLSSRVSTQITLVGVVVARTETDLGFPLNGTIAERPVDLGDLVKKGDALAQLDTDDLDADVRAAEAGVTVAEAQLRSAQDAASRAQSLSQRGTDSVTKLEDALRLLASAKARFEQAMATLERAEDMRSLSTLRAPNDGIITAVYAQTSSVLNTGQPIVRLAEMEGREITIDVTEQDLLELKIGTVFNAELAADTNVTAQASLSRIDQVASSSTRTRRVYLTLIDAPTGFRLGALVRVTPDANETFGLSLNRDAILDLDGAPSVWVVDRKTNVAHLTSVKLGEAFGRRVQILDGLDAGDEVITKGINSLEDGQVVGPRVVQ
jgi:RND family efflux transporter MFP subunit